jgi:non-lysosomal glucosylceramidase
MSLRKQADFLPGVGIKSDGSIPMRIDGQPGSPDPLPKQPILFGPGYEHWASIDGQCGIILRTYRNHLTSSNADFVKEYWPQIKKATQWLFAQDSDGDNLPDRVTHHTLDEDIAGPSPWISSLWLAATSASEKMAVLAGDEDFANECRKRVAEGQKNFVAKLWNGDRFVHLAPDSEKWRPGSYDGSHIDQVLGQQWAWRTGLGRILPEKETKAALASIFRNNYFKDLGPYYAKPENKPSRPFSVAGNAGTLMATWPEGSYRPDGKMPGHEWNAGNVFHQGFYNETMSGFEHAFASHLIYEGMVTEGLTVERAIHDRHQPDSPKMGNPFNEPEAGNHYSRAMASYAVFLALGGFDYNGPAGHIGFAPRITPEKFKATFTAAEGWGSFNQKAEGGNLKAEINLKRGQLRLRSISLGIDSKPASATVEVNGKPLAVELTFADGTSTLTLPQEVTLTAGDAIQVHLKAS